MRIGYSFWGFLGPGIIDTPDGGRSHRRTLVDGLIAAGHGLLFLQANRDLREAGLDLRGGYAWDPGLPDVDVLFCEWRWPIPGRNTTPCSAPGHTCDLHRQEELVAEYTIRRGVPTLLWDKDRQLADGDPLRRRRNVAVCEPALRPHPGASSLLFPVADHLLDAADPVALAAMPRPLPLVYVGNQYDRDEAFDAFFAPAAASFPHRVAGKWTCTGRWPHVRFTGRCAFADVAPLYRSALATVLLLPDRYAQCGQMTQRLFEAVLAGCLPVTPAGIVGAHRFTPPVLHAADGEDVISRVEQLRALAGTPAHAELLGACLRALAPFRLSRQLATLNRILERLAGTSLQ
ncbi:MAG: glycosyltransferase family protein [Egibacteraceae bacterium]